ncbi:MAG: Ig-like domain-containing protein, partial [Flavobacteriales bacterium]
NNDQKITAGTIIKGNKVTFLSKDNASSDSFTFTVNDGLLESEEGTISIKVITDAPTANPQNVNVTEQIEKNIVLNGSDAEGDPLSYIVTVLPTNGVLKNNGEIINSEKLPKTIDNSKLFYMSSSDTALTDSFSYKVNDGISDSPPAIVTINISPVNDKPTALPKTKNVSEQVSDNIILEGTDPDGDDLTYIITKEPLNGTYTLNANTVVYVSNSDTATVDSFKYKVNDGKLDSDIVDVQISIEPVNDVPTVISKNLSTIEDIELKFVLEGEDVDGDKLTYSIEASPIKGEATLKDSLVTYIPNAGYYGTDSIIFKANDGTALSSSGFIKITITSNDFDEDGILNDFDTCPDTPIGSKVNTDGCVVFELPFNNNKVEVISATCVRGNDGSLSLSVEDKSHDYSISVNGNNFGQSIVISGDNKTASVTGLAKGTYSICFKVDGQADYEQCFEVAIGEPKALSAFIDVDNDKRTTSIQLGGSKSYNIEVNGERFDVKGDNFNTTLPTGLSIIKISTDLDCQGLIEREIFISEDILYYPNPTRGEVDVFVNGEDKGVKMSVFTTKGDLVFTRDQEILDSRKTELDLSGVPSGTYIVTLEGTTVRKTFKIVKK